MRPRLQRSGRPGRRRPANRRGKEIVAMPAGWEQYLADHEHQHLDALLAFLRIPSVSTDPQRTLDVGTAASWVFDQIRQAGVPQVTVLDTDGYPVVYGHWHVADDLPTALIYGHYDVQPAEPLDLWQSPPFEPDIRDGRIYARGAADMKGNLLTAIQGVEALARTAGAPPINVKFAFEGEEEIGSPNLPAFVREQHDLLACDFVISADGGMHGPDTPSLTVAYKGLAGCQINVRTAAADLHSGQFGAAVPNAIQALVQLAASFHTPEGRVAVEGFYDRVRDLSEADRAEIAAVPFDEEAFRQQVGAPALWGEPGYSALARRWSRPTADFNGIWGGFTGEGAKTVTPAEAHLKVTCRLVPDQDPDEILDLIERHVARHCPPSAQATVERLPGSAHPFAIRRDHPALRAAATVLREVYGTEPLFTRAGGTIPATAIFQRELDADTISFAWSMPDSQAHAPNEWYRLEDFYRGRRAYAAYLTALAKAG